jgi:hypothetical protein
MIKHECLSFEELPKPGMFVAIDAEFVSMQQVTLPQVAQVVVADADCLGRN